MKYASLIFIAIGLMASIFSLFTFQTINSAYYLAAVVRLFSNEFSVLELREHSPFEITNQLSTYFYILLSVTFCLIASLMELKRMKTVGRNARSASVIALTVAVLLLNSNVYDWNAMPV